MIEHLIIEQIVLILLIVFALFSIFAPNLKLAIIGSSVFGLWISLAYLLFHAPDVAVAEAVIASSLGTILFILTIKKYNDISVRPTNSRIMHSISAFVLLFFAFGLTLFLHFQTEVVNPAVLFERIQEIFFAYGRVTNPVGSIYLHYRVFDTMFEALMLLLSVMGVVHLITDKDKGGEANG